MRGGREHACGVNGEHAGGGEEHAMHFVAANNSGPISTFNSLAASRERYSGFEVSPL